MTMTSEHSSEKNTTIILAMLKDVAEAVVQAAEAGTLKEVFQQIAYVAQQLVHSRYAALAIPNEDGTMKYFEVVGVSPDEMRSIAHPPIGKGLLGVMMHERKILRLEHMGHDPRSSGFPANHPPMDRLLGVPIQTGQQLFGILYLTDRLDDLAFTQEDQWLVESLAGYAALAIADSNQREQHGRLTLLEERERVGMELHDGIIQSLYAIGMQLQLLKLRLPAADEDVSTATKSLDVVIEDIRHYILNLKVSNYEQHTVRSCLLDVVARVHVPESLQVHVKALDRQPPFAPPVLEAVCQIAYEAVSNIIRHAHATEAFIEVSEATKQFKMVIRDNGRSFSPRPSVEHEGLGLRNMMQRARIYGGEIQIDSNPGTGTRLTLELPI